MNSELELVLRRYFVLCFVDLFRGSLLHASYPFWEFREFFGLSLSELSLSLCPVRGSVSLQLGLFRGYHLQG